MRISNKQQQLLALTDGVEIRNTVVDLYAYAESMPTQRPEVASHWEAKQDALRLLGLLGQVIDQIDYEHLSTKDRKQVALVLTQLRQVKQFFTFYCLRYDWYTLYFIRSGRAFGLPPYNVHQLLSRLYGTCNALVNMQREITDAQQPPKQAAVKGATFPTYNSANPTVRSALLHLRQTWEEASLRVLNAEDTFLINAIATSYLPDAWRLLGQLANHSTVAKQRGEEMFLKQLALMQEQVDGLLAKVETSVLSEMAAHTTFLENRAGDGRSKLDFRQ